MAHGKTRIESNEMRVANDRWRQAGFLFWLFIGFLVLVFFTGGGSRADIQSLTVLRPVAVGVCGIALFSLRWHHVQANKFLFAISIAIVSVPLVQLIPLPFSLSHGHETVRSVDFAVGLDSIWRPISISPASTWNAFYALFVPLGAMLLIVQLNREERFLLLPALIGLGLLSGVWGLLQAIGNPTGPLYLYRLTNYGTAVGLFANRNHQALLLACLFPMLAAYVSMSANNQNAAKYRNVVLLLAVAVLVPLLLVTGSRAGLLLGLLSMLAAAILYRKPQGEQSKKRKTAKFNQQYLLVAFGGIALAGVTILMSRAEALQRLMTSDQSEDMRWQIWERVLALGQDFFPFGSGAGSASPAYQVGQPVQTLVGNYVNQAHNDWIDVYMTGGLLAMAIIVACLLAFLKMAIAVSAKASEPRRGDTIARLGVALLALLGAASAIDYPLRTPIVSILLVIAVAWAAMLHERGDKSAGSI